MAWYPQLGYIRFGLRLTPNDPAVTFDTNTCTLNPSNCWVFSWSHLKSTGKPTEKCSVLVSFLFGFFILNRPKPTDIWWKPEKPTEPFFVFGSRPCLRPPSDYSTYVQQSYYQVPQPRNLQKTIHVPPSIERAWQQHDLLHVSGTLPAYFTFRRPRQVGLYKQWLYFGAVWFHCL